MKNIRALLKKLNTDSTGERLYIEFYYEDIFSISDGSKYGVIQGVREGNRITYLYNPEIIKDFGLPKGLKFLYDFSNDYNQVIRTNNKYPGPDTFIRVK